MKVIHSDPLSLDNAYPQGELPWQLYHTVRNTVFRACRKHGPTGPLGELQIVEGADSMESRRNWELGDDPCDYFLVDDQLNHERYLYVEVLATERLSRAWVDDVSQALQRYPAWGLIVNNIVDAGLIIFANKVVVHGAAFRSCRDLDDVLNVARRRLGGTKEWKARQAAQKQRGEILLQYFPGLCAAGGFAAATVIGALAVLFGIGWLSILAAVVSGLAVGGGIWLWRRDAWRKRQFAGQWYFGSGENERCIELDAEDDSAMVTVGDTAISMEYAFDWTQSPPRLSLTYMCIASDDDGDNKIEPFSVRVPGDVVVQWVTTYAMRRIARDKIQLAPPQADFRKPGSERFPIYERRHDDE